MESKCPDEILRMRGMNLNLRVLRMLEDTFSLGEAHIVIEKGVLSKGVAKKNTLHIGVLTQSYDSIYI